MKEIDVREKSIVEKIKKKFPQLEVAFAKRKKPGKAALVIVPLLLTALGTGVGLGIYYNQKPNEPVDVIKQDTGENHRIYLVANDKTTVPLTVKTKKRNTAISQMRLRSVFKMRTSILNTATTEQMGYGSISFFVYTKSANTL